MGNKYNAISANGFDSKKEYRRYQELLLLEKAGKIKDLDRQVHFTLLLPQWETYPRYGKKGQRIKDGRRCVELACVYIADFVYTDENGQTVVEDVKGYKKGSAYALFALKRKLMLFVHGIKVREV